MDGMSTPLLTAPEVITGRMRMLGDRILVRPLSWDGEDVHGAGSRLVVLRSGRPVRGEVVEVGPGKYPLIRLGKTPDGRHMRTKQSKYFQPTEVKVGDMVEYGCLKAFDGQSYQFPEVIYNGVKHVVITERDVTGIWEKRRQVVQEAQYA